MDISCWTPVMSHVDQGEKWGRGVGETDGWMSRRREELGDTN